MARSRPPLSRSPLGFAVNADPRLTPSAHPLGTVDIAAADGGASGRRIDVEVRVVFDGIEYVGRLWFTIEGNDRAAVTDRGVFSGRTLEEVLARARDLSPAELAQRYRRGSGEQRRYLGLRRATNDILGQIRHLNGVSLSMHAGLLDAESAADEIQRIESRLHHLIDRLRDAAGVEARGEEPPDEDQDAA